MTGHDADATPAQRFVQCADVITFLLLLIIVVFALVYVMAHEISRTAVPAVGGPAMREHGTHRPPMKHTPGGSEQAKRRGAEDAR